MKYFYINKEGEWFHSEGFPENDGEKGKPLSVNFEPLLRCDILFPLLHGTNGEDGTIQGFFEILGKAYVGCDYRSAAICMDKVLTKTVCGTYGIRTAPDVHFSKEEWKKSRTELLESIIKKLRFPVFVKTNHLGSSVGVFKIETADYLEEKIDQAFTFDYEILVEEGIKGREIEFSVFGNDYIYVFPPGEVISNGEVYDYESKYGNDAFPTVAKANLSEELVETGCKMAAECYQHAKCKGLTRIDFFLDDDGKFWLNEMNPMPGFTQISLFPSICEANGLKYDKLIDKLIYLGLQSHRRKAKMESGL